MRSYWFVVYEYVMAAGKGQSNISLEFPGEHFLVKTAEAFIKEHYNLAHCCITNYKRQTEEEHQDYVVTHINKAAKKKATKKKVIKKTSKKTVKRKTKRR